MSEKTLRTAVCKLDCAHCAKPIKKGAKYVMVGGHIVTCSTACAESQIAATEARLDREFAAQQARPVISDAERAEREAIARRYNDTWS